VIHRTRDAQEANIMNTQRNADAARKDDNPERTLTTGEIAELAGCVVWQLQAAIRRGLLAGPVNRVGVFRVWSAEDLPRVVAALKLAGYLGDANSIKGKGTRSRATTRPAVTATGPTTPIMA
jgi:hypothetical protein